MTNEELAEIERDNANRRAAALSLHLPSHIIDGFDDTDVVIAEVRRLRLIEAKVHEMRQQQGDNYEVLASDTADELWEMVDDPPRKTGSIREALDKSYEAGGCAWDGIKDPEAFLGRADGD